MLCLAFLNLKHAAKCLRKFDPRGAYLRILNVLIFDIYCSDYSFKLRVMFLCHVSVERVVNDRCCWSVYLASMNCDREFSSTVAREGTFSSPGYPHPHPGDITCRYSFQGHGRERVQIIFDELDLNKPNATIPTKTKLVLFFVYYNAQQCWALY